MARKKSLQKWRQGFQNITKPQGIFNISLFVVGDFFIHEKITPLASNNDTNLYEKLGFVV